MLTNLMLNFVRFVELLTLLKNWPTFRQQLSTVGQHVTNVDHICLLRHQKDYNFQERVQSGAVQECENISDSKKCCKLSIELLKSASMPPRLSANLGLRNVTFSLSRSRDISGIFSFWRMIRCCCLLSFRETPCASPRTSLVMCVRRASHFTMTIVGFLRKLVQNRISMQSCVKPVNLERYARWQNGVLAVDRGRSKTKRDW